MFQNSRETSLLSLAATVSWPFPLKHLHLSKTSFWHRKKTFIMAVAFCNRKLKKTKKVWQSGSSLTVFKIIRRIHLRKKTNEGTSSVHQHQWGERRLPQQGVRQAVVAAAAAAMAAARAYCSMLLIVLLVDSSFRCLVVYLRGTTKAT